MSHAGKSWPPQLLPQCHRDAWDQSFFQHGQVDSLPLPHSMHSFIYHMLAFVWFWWDWALNSGLHTRATPPVHFALVNVEMGSLENCLLALTSNCHRPALSLPSSWDYRREHHLSLCRGCACESVRVLRNSAPPHGFLRDKQNSFRSDTGAAAHRCRPSTHLTRPGPPSGATLPVDWERTD
jgi:hypothetical protein